MERLRIASMSFGASGIGRVDGKSWLVPNVAPGDLIEAEPITVRRDYTVGQAARIVSAGPDRREAPCKYVPKCGGCSWQHITYPAQVPIKGELLAAEFKHRLGIELNPQQLIEPAPAEFGYRSRIRLKIAGDGSVGYREAGSDRPVAIDECRVAIPPIQPMQHLAREWSGRCDEIEIVEGRRGVVLIADMRNGVKPRDTVAAQRAIAIDSRIAGVILRSGNERITVGEISIEVEAEAECAVIADADCFAQVNREQNQKLVAAVMQQAAIKPGLTVLDLFCGAGNFVLPAARRGASVTGVDSDSRAIEAARRNASRMGLHTAQFIAMNAEETARFLKRANYRPDLVMLDPPRTGATRLMDAIARLRPDRIIYVSCDARTLVRDLAQLRAASYKIGVVRGFDFFPNTHHVEVMTEVLLT
jgi:23S rRNA (uracil1939-C5)-methyltransferase